MVTRKLPDGVVAGEVRCGAVPCGERRWVDLLPGALVRLGVQVGDRVMVSCLGGDHVPGIVAHDGERVAIHCEAEIARDCVLVRRRKDR